uniref:Replicative helicase n=1 Tax=Siphoviridae sp. ctZHD14 TaxID=2827891 RepID=A0A8S5SVQ5_9CAUD|nr:MAG TPA: replicative helicase [Siphoviridae sp. ctZHD14]
MAGSKYYDANAAIQVIGCVLNNPSLLDQTDAYSFGETDFNCNEFHRVIFGAVYTLHGSGTEKITTSVVEDYLKDKEKSWGVYKANSGSDWLHQAYIQAEPMNFQYYYDKLKKMTLLRTYNDIGLNLDWIYDPDNILNLQKKEEQEKALDNMTLQEIAEEIENRVVRVKELIVDNDTNESRQAGQGLRELLEELKKNPIQGYPLYDPVLNEIALGARSGTFYLRSAGTGVGKSRTAMADALYLGCSEIWDKEKKEWIECGVKVPNVFISVELDYDELQTMAVAFVSGVSEAKIIQGGADFDEQERIEKATKIVEESETYFEYMPDYSMRDVENCIKRNIRTRKATAVFFDYLTSSMSIIEEVTKASGGMRIREDQVLFLLASKIKDIAGKYKVFISSSSQLNGSFKTERILDQNVLAGAKAMANRVDFGSIMVDVVQEDLDALETLLGGMDVEEPNIKMSVYKNRRGKTNRVILWMKADKGTCRYETLIDKKSGRALVTDFDYNLVDVMGGE